MTFKLELQLHVTTFHYVFLYVL